MYSSKLDYVNATIAYNNYLNALAVDKRTSDVVYDFARLYYSWGNTDSIKSDVKKIALHKADSLFAQVIALDPTSYRGYIWRARTNSSLDPETTQGLAKPYYEQTIAVVEAKADPRYNPVIIECSRYLGYFYYVNKDNAQSKVYWNKILTIDPKNDIALKAIDGLDKSIKSKK